MNESWWFIWMSLDSHLCPIRETWHDSFIWDITHLYGTWLFRMGQVSLWMSLDSHPPTCRVCVYARTCICVWCVCTCARVSVSGVCVRAHVYLCLVSVYVRMCIYVWCVCTRACVSVSGACVRAHVYLCRVCVYAHMCVCVSVGIVCVYNVYL